MAPRLVRCLAVAASVMLLSTGCEFDGAYDLPLPGSPVDEGNSYEITADFADILSVVPKSPVMVDDVTVGEVTEVERVGWHAQITMRVRKDVVLPDNAIADIRQVSLLGEKYVALEAPSEGASAGQLGEGDNIPLEATGRNPEVEEVLGALSFLLSGGGVAQLGTITNELNNVMTGRTERLRHLLGSLEGVVGTLDAQKADIINALESMNNLTKTLNAERQAITGALDVAGPAIDVLADQHDELISMLSALDELGVVGTRVIRASKDDLIKTLTHLEPVLAKLRQSGKSLAPGLNLLISFPFPKEASEIVLGDYANTSIRADINLENFMTDDGGGLPDLPDLPEVPGVPGLDLVTRCLQSGSVASKPCQKVLKDAEQLADLQEACKRPRYDDNEVCAVIEALPGGGGGGGGSGGGEPPVPGLPPLPGLGRLNLALSSGVPSSDASTWALYGGEG